MTMTNSLLSQVKEIVLLALGIGHIVTLYRLISHSSRLFVEKYAVLDFHQNHAEAPIPEAVELDAFVSGISFLSES